VDARASAYLEDVAPRPSPARPLKVAVLVDLAWGPQAGGHVKCWERLATAAACACEDIDLTVHFAGATPEIRPLGEHVRYVIEPPVFSTQRLGFLSHAPDHTDLAPWHPRLARVLPRYDVIHTTDAFFAYARTAVSVARRQGLPLVNSVHTNTPEYARLFTGQTVERVLGRGCTSRLLVERVGVGEWIERRMLRRLARHQDRCAFALFSRPDTLDAALPRLRSRAGLLRRGIDHSFFHPDKRDRDWLAAAHGVPRERFVIFTAGRINRGKNALFLVEIVEALLARGVDAHLLWAGEGELRETIRQRLGPRASCPGAVDPAHIARLHASAEIFALASRVEELANVTLEALSSGLPVLVATESGMGRVVLDGKTGFALPTATVGPWVEAIAALDAEPERRCRMGRVARRYAETHLPDWGEVLAEDLMPRWRQAARLRHLEG
jgi:glycosyltransferase involved in cell wall biosynthesis